MERKLSVEMGFSTASLTTGVDTAISKLASLGQSAIQYGNSFATAIGNSMASAGASITRFAVQSNASLASFYERQDQQRKLFSAGWGRLADDMVSAGKKLTLGITIPLALLGTQAFVTYGQIDALKLGLENITGSAAGANARFTELRQVAALPGLGLEEAVQGDVRLQAVGFSAKTSKEALLQFGNALALTGGGKFELGNVITQLTQMGSKSKVLSEDLKPILTASPAVAKAIKEMFGTVDSEGISAKLEAAGRGPQQFIADLVAKLGTLERVKGGPKNAIENLGDSLKIAEYNFGAAADKAFGLTNIINQLGNFVTGVADKFSTLSPGVQQVIFVIGGAIAVLGPLLVGLGGLIALVPAVVSGFTLISTSIGISLGPIALIGAAVAGAAYLIIKNWDSIKTALTNSGIWDSTVRVVSSAWDTIKSVFSMGVGFLKTIWDRFGGWLIAGVKTAFEAVAAVFNLGAGILTGIFRTITGVLTLDWRTALDGIVTIAKSVWNAVVDVFRIGAGVIGRTIAEVFRTVGAESLADKVTAGIDKALTKLDGLKGKITSVQSATTATAKVAVVGKATTSTDKPFDYSGIDLGGSALEKAKDRLKELKDLIGSGKLSGKDVSALQAEFDTLTKRVDAATESTKKHTAAHQTAMSTLTTNQRILKQLELRYKELGDNAPASLARQVGQFQKLVEWEKQSVKGAIDLGSALKILPAHNASNQRVGALVSAGGVTTPGLNGTSATIGLPGLTEFQRTTSAQIQDAALKLTEDKKLLRFALSDFPNIIGSVGDQMKAIADSDPLNTKGLVSKMLESAQAIQAAIQVAKQNLVTGGADLLASFGEGLASGKTSLKSVVVSVVGLIADYVMTIGKAMIVTAIPLIASGYGSLIGFKQLATGGALIAAGGLAKGLAATAFADGGTVEKPTYSLTGEYVGASRNPEFIAPASKAGGIIAQNLVKLGAFGNGGGGTLTARVSGGDLEFVLTRHQTSKAALGGGKG